MRYVPVILILAGLTVRVLMGPSPVFGFENEWGGHVKLQGTMTDVDGTSVLAYDDGLRKWDGFFDVRLKDTATWNDRVMLDVHYELSGETGDSHRALRAMSAVYPFIPSGFVGSASPDDRTSLFDLSHTIRDNDDGLLWHRLDRLVLSVKHPYGEIRLGRQAVTWGNGLVFNPMDILSPFAPTDTQRDYKTGADLALVTAVLEGWGEVQCAAVPRRDPLTGDIETDLSSLAAKIHGITGAFEWDAMAARHYDEILVGLGFSRNLGGAVFRIDGVGARPDDGYGGRDAALSLVANLDYSWVFLGRNMYGLAEYFHNGFGRTRMGRAITDVALLQRVARGETFTLGKDYAAGQLRIECHPLVNATLGIIQGLNHSTGIFQPRIQWDVTQNGTLQCGMNLRYGEKGSEFRGVEIPGTGWYLSGGNAYYLITSYYF